MKRPHNDRGQGRKAIPLADRAVVGSIRLTLVQWAKFRALGGIAWLRSKIDEEISAHKPTNLPK